MNNEDCLEELMSPSEINHDNITSAFIICIYNNRIIVGYNNWRKKWELPAGKREITDKNIDETAKREFKEETHMDLSKLKLVRIAKLKNINTNIIRYRAIFLGEIENFIPFKKVLNDEMDCLRLEYIDNLVKLNIDCLDLYILKKLQHHYLS